LYEEKIESFRNYCNKIWNVAKFTLMNLENADFNPADTDKGKIKFEEDDQQMLDHMSELIENTTRNMENFHFGVVAQSLYESLWHTFADEYIEKIKARTYTKDREGNPINTSPEAIESRKSALWTLWYCLDNYLRLLHPFIPFITERIWAEVPKTEDESETLMYAEWPR
jgi:valyl-tRNA synthetase